jgi:hypothetical protein
LSPTRSLVRLVLRNKPLLTRPVVQSADVRPPVPILLSSFPADVAKLKPSSQFSEDLRSFTRQSSYRYSLWSCVAAPSTPFS